MCDLGCKYMCIGCKCAIWDVNLCHIPGMQAFFIYIDTYQCECRIVWIRQLEMPGLSCITYLLRENVGMSCISYPLYTDSIVTHVQNTKMAVRETADVGIKLNLEAHFPDVRFKMTCWRQVL